ncbi:MAG: hypothetical protein ACLVIY_10590 [Anaerobutyricum soehngenii]
MELSTIEEGLRKDKQYSFTVHETDETGEVRLKDTLIFILMRELI